MQETNIDVNGITQIKYLSNTDDLNGVKNNFLNNYGNTESEIFNIADKCSCSSRHVSKNMQRLNKIITLIHRGNSDKEFINILDKIAVYLQYLDEDVCRNENLIALIQKSKLSKHKCVSFNLIKTIKEKREYIKQIKLFLVFYKMKLSKKILNTFQFKGVLVVKDLLENLKKDISIENKFKQKYKSDYETLCKLVEFRAQLFSILQTSKKSILNSNRGELN